MEQSAEVHARMAAIANQRRLSAASSPSGASVAALIEDETKTAPIPASPAPAGDVEMVGLSSRQPIPVPDKVLEETVGAVKAIVARPLPSWTALL